MAENMSIKKATFFNMIGKYSNVIIQLILNMILARLLSPKDFGIVAVVTIFTNFFSILSDMGISTGIIQVKSLTEKDNNSIFSFTIYLAIVLSLLFALLGIPISIIYDDPVLIKLCALLSISVFFNTINMVPNSLLLKNQEFLIVAIRTIVVNLFGAFIGIALAFLGYKYYAIVINSIAISIGLFIVTYIKTNLKFLKKPDFSAINKIKDLSTYQFAFSFVNYFARNLDNLLIGSNLGSTQLGYYDKGYKLITYPNIMLTGVISSSLHPILSNYFDDKRKIYEEYMKVLKFIMFVGIPISAVCIACPDEIVQIMYGSQWEASVVILKVLSFSLLSQLCQSSAGSIFQSLGKTKLLFKTGMINTIILILAICFSIFVFSNLTILGIFVSGAYNIAFFVCYYLLMEQGFEYKFIDFLKEIKYLLLTFMLMLSISVVLDQFIVFSNMFAGLFVKCGIIVLVYMVAILFNKEFRKEAIKIFNKLLKRGANNV